MKLFINTAIVFSVCLAINNVSFYDLQFESIDGAVVKTSSFRGKKVVIAVVSNDQNVRGLINYLDSVQNANDSVRVIAIPTGDFKGNVNTQSLKDLKQTLSITVTKPMNVKRDNGAKQHALFSWLTNSTQNSHFNMDVSGEGQVFIISAKGTLYSVLPNQTPLHIVTKIINQPFAE